MGFFLGSVFLHIIKQVCKQICPVWLQGRKDWIHAPLEPLVGVGGGVGLHSFCFEARLLTLPLPPHLPHPPPPPPLFFISSWCSPIALLLADSHVPSLISRVPRPSLSELPLGIDYYLREGKELFSPLFGCVRCHKNVTQQDPPPSDVISHANVK